MRYGNAPVSVISKATGGTTTDDGNKRQDDAANYRYFILMRLAED